MCGFAILVALCVFRDLIEYHMRTGKPVTQSSGAVLLNPISRPDWQLDNRDVILLEKIGQVSLVKKYMGSIFACSF